MQQPLGSGIGQLSGNEASAINISFHSDVLHLSSTQALATHMQTRTPPREEGGEVKSRCEQRIRKAFHSKSVPRADGHHNSHLIVRAHECGSAASVTEEK